MKTIHFLFALLVSCVSCAQNSISDFDTYFSNLHQEGEFNGNVLIVSDGKIVHKNSYGTARGDKSEALNASHYFQVGSVYKEFPGVAIMQLEEQGILSVEDKLSEYVKDLPAWADDIELKHLLQYSSGLPKVNWGTFFGGSQTVNRDLVLASLADKEALEFTPGSDYIYSNYNPFLLMKVVESASGMPYEDYFNQKIVEAHQIEGLLTTNKYPYRPEEQASFAYPFNTDFEEDQLNIELPLVCMTTEGMYRWFSLLDNYKVLSQASVRKLSETVKPGNNTQSPLGRVEWEEKEMALHLHHGSSGNYECLARHYREGEIYIILLTNQKNRNLHEIADAVLAKLKE